MSEKSRTIHISEIDSYLASVYMNGGGEPFGLRISSDPGKGSLYVSEIEIAGPGGGEGLDFELSSCECSSLDEADVADYLKKPVVTSSAYELFDFILSGFSSFDCRVEFTGNAWKIKIINPS